MQECCRWIFHYDIPWSPIKLQQRNGRVSRHGQVRDVSIHYFRCDQEEDFEFLLLVARKINKVQEDLGSVEKVFDSALQAFFRGNRFSESELDQAVQNELQSSPERSELGQSSCEQIQNLTKHSKELLHYTETQMSLSPQALIQVLQTSLSVEGAGSLNEINRKPGFYRLDPPPRWKTLVNETLQTGEYSVAMELVFDASLVEKEINQSTGTNFYPALV